MELLIVLMSTLAYIYVTLGLAWVLPKRALLLLGMGTGVWLFALLIPLQGFGWPQLYFSAVLMFFGVLLGTLIGRSKPN